MAGMMTCSVSAQFLKKLGQQASQAAQKARSVEAQAEHAKSTANMVNEMASSTLPVSQPTSKEVFYVSTNGSARADGKSAETPMKDIQKAIDTAPAGATIRIAEGNYLGKLNAGYIEITKWLTLEGGWNNDFTKRDPLTFVTKIEPTTDQLGTSGSKALINVKGLDDVNYRINGTLVIDGIHTNLGYQVAYKPCDPSDPACGCPSDKFETGRMLDEQVEHQLFHSEGAIAGNVIIRNCVFANSPYFAIQFNTRCGEIEIYNCVFVSNRYASVRIDGWDKEGRRSHVNFHHNTVAFSWCRTKVMEDMGYGYEFMNKVNSDVHNNIFVCNNYAAVARTRIDSPKEMEAKKVTNLYDNLFFMNAADLQLPAPGGGKWTNVMCDQFEEVDEATLPKAEGNKELSAGDSFVKVIDEDYLDGFANLKIVSSTSFDRNSAANQFRQAHGLNMQGTEIVRPSMFGNRYNFERAFNFFGAKADYGAQRPQ